MVQQGGGEMITPANLRWTSVKQSSQLRRVWQCDLGRGKRLSLVAGNEGWIAETSGYGWGRYHEVITLASTRREAIGRLCAAINWGAK